MELYQGALDKLNRLLTEARAHGTETAEAASLATADTSGRPSIRMITVLAVEPEGLLFFVNIQSGKGHQLIDNPRASLCFYWPLMQEQVIIEGDVEKQAEAVSDQYWHRRMRESQLAAWASEQSAPIPGKEALQEQVRSYKSKFDFDKVARHENWHAFRIVPDRMEFWPTGWQRLHERVRYLRSADGEWRMEKLSP
ncbi:MAG: pyridoxamine 5'-phosphate oxidase [Pseudomonadales bacterium]|nr:pyridoxamine 5'-phosphate oxidase [Pseudomonadales bacterium]